MTPIPAAETEGEERFNDSFRRIRSGIERCNGVLKMRFRCLLKHRVLHYSPSIAASIINACVVLHNMYIEAGVPEPLEDENVVDIDYGIYAPLALVREQTSNAMANHDLLEARELRWNIINNHFLI